MASSSSLLAFYFILVAVIVHRRVGDAIGDHRVRWAPMGAGCGGSIEECMGEGEVGMEMSRRILATSQYISYKALQRNTVPCSHRGASYYNCRAGAQANPYTRGCASITRCRTT